MSFYFDISVTKKGNNTLMRAKVRATVHNGCTAPDDCTLKRSKFFLIRLRFTYFFRGGAMNITEQICISSFGPGFSP